LALNVTKNDYALNGTGKQEAEFLGFLGSKTAELFRYTDVVLQFLRRLFSDKSQLLEMVSFLFVS
jgi:hypothetical protein